MTQEKVRILSTTLAEIYMRQGHFDKAREVYERLLSKDRRIPFTGGGSRFFLRKRLTRKSSRRSRGS